MRSSRVKTCLCPCAQMKWVGRSSWRAWWVMPAGESPRIRRGLSPGAGVEVVRAKSADQHHRTSAMLGGSGRFAWSRLLFGRRRRRAQGRACRWRGRRGACARSRRGHRWDVRASTRVAAARETAHPPPYAHYIPGRSHARRGQKQSYKRLCQKLGGDNVFEVL